MWESKKNKIREEILVKLARLPYKAIRRKREKRTERGKDLTTSSDVLVNKNTGKRTLFKRGGGNQDGVTDPPKKGGRG